MTDYETKGFDQLGHRFADLAERHGYEVLHSCVDRHGVYEWACGRRADGDSNNDTYVLLACLPLGEGEHGRLELAVVAERLPVAVRHVTAASSLVWIELAPSWLEDHWDEASRVAESLRPRRALEGTTPF